MSKALAFISHSSKDKIIATNLAEHLRRHDVDVWIDHEQIKFGDSIPARISAGLSTCDVILVIISFNFVQSSWCRVEYETLLVKEINSDRTLVIPIRIDATDVPLLLSAKRYVDLRNGLNEQSIAELARTIIDYRSETLLQRLVPTEPQPQSYECSLLSIIISSVLSEIPVVSLADSELLSGKSLLDLYRTVEILIGQYQNLCDEILNVLLEANIKDNFYGSADQIAEARLLRANRRLLSIARDMREISDSLDGLLRKDSMILQRLKGLSEICTQISIVEDFLILKLGTPSSVPNTGAAKINRYPRETPWVPVYDNLREQVYDSDFGIQMVNDFNHVLIDLDSYKADLRKVIARLQSNESMGSTYRVTAVSKDKPAEDQKEQ